MAILADDRQPAIEEDERIMDKREFLKGSAALAAMKAVGIGVAQTGTSVPRENWSGTFHYSTQKVFQPASLEEVQRAVMSVSKVRALGTRHSFNGIADSTVAQISTLGLTDFKLDATAKTVTVGAGIKYGDLAVQLDKAGFALENLASLPHISVGGSIATATHGSGLRNGNLATSVRGIRFVAADGSVHSLSRGKDGDAFHGAVVGMGSLGVVTEVTLDVEPSYEMTQIVYQGLNFHELERNFEAIMGAGYSVSLFTNWQHHEAWEVWIKRRVDQGGGAIPAETFYGAKLAKEKLHPVQGQSAEKTTDQLNTVGKWYERLPHFKMGFTPSTGHEIQTEYFVPFESAYEAVLAVESLREQITPHLFVTELRAIAADELWMSMAYKRRSLAIHFTWKPEWDAVQKVLPQIEAKLRPFDPRPHWAKVNTLRAAEIDPLYPRVRDFEALMKQYDPKGKFVNAYMQEKIFG
jgi:xylitol oxidase